MTSLKAGLDTPIVRRIDEKIPDFGAQVPLGRPAQPAELAPIYVVLASQESSYVTGEVYGVTGGNPLP